MSYIKLYGSVDEVGGNKILLCSGGERTLFDFGKSYSKWPGYHGTYFTPRNIEELVTISIIPPPEGNLKGLYARLSDRSEDMRSRIQDPSSITKLEPSPPVRTCFVSHVTGDREHCSVYIHEEDLAQAHEGVKAKMTIQIHMDDRRAFKGLGELLYPSMGKRLQSGDSRCTYSRSTTRLTPTTLPR